jgi:hypothetical protein
VRRRLTLLDLAARPSDHLPWNKPGTARQQIRAAGACLVLWAVNFMLIVVITVSDRDLDWKHDQLGHMLWLLAGQAAVLLLGTAGCWLVGACRTLRRRAPVLRRRHAGRYVSADELTDLRDNAPMVGNLAIQAMCQHDRLARSPAWQQHWLTDSIDEHEPDTVLWHVIQTAVAAAATMDAVNDAAGHHELREQALAGQHDVAAATRALRADLTWLTTVADAAASIDTTLTAAHQYQHRVHRGERANQQLTRRRATLATACAAHRPSPADLEAATAIANYATQQLSTRQPQ